MARKKKEEPASGGAPEWMCTYGDLVTLLMCFFVLLFSMSTIEATKFEQVASALSGRTVSVITGGANDSIINLPGMGIMEMPVVESIVNESPQENDGGEGEDVERTEEIAGMASDFETYFAENNLAEMVEVLVERESLRIRFTDGVLFDSGKADLKPEYLGVLEVIAEEILNHQDVELRIEGHTDNTPMSTLQFPSNEHLSAGRAISVAKFFMNVKGFEPSKIEFVGYGEYRPIAPNDTPENKSKNRRVEIVIIIPDRDASA